MSQQTCSTDIVKRSKSLLLDNYGRLPLSVSKAHGSEFFDCDNKRYIDLFVGFGAGGLLGHCHPSVSEAISTQAQTLVSHGNLFTSEPQVDLAEKLTKTLPGWRAFFCHSGAEAGEAALKLARKADPKRYKIICFTNCFHGRTMGTLSLCPESFQQGFEPMLAGALRAEFNNIESVKALLDSETAGIFVEPIQGEGGLIVPSQEFIQGLRDICDANNIPLIFDEVWTAPGRTGKFYAFEHFGIKPDVITLAKALGAGLPVAACLVSEKWSSVLGPGSHGCTLGGNPLCAAAANAALEQIEKEDLVSKAAQLGKESMDYLETNLSGLLKSVRGLGFMFGVELIESIEAKAVMNQCLEKGVFIAPAKQNVVRFAPALNIPKKTLFEGLDVVIDVIRSNVNK